MTDLGKIFAKVMSYKKFGFIEYEKFSKVKNKKTERKMRKIFGKTKQNTSSKNTDSGK